MENHLVVLLLSVVILIGAFYGYTVEQKFVQIKNDLLNHEKDIKEVKEVKVELESTKKKLAEVTLELEATKKELIQVHVELESSKNALIKVTIDLDSTKEQMNLIRTEMIEKDNARRKETNQIQADVIGLPEELNKIKTELHSQRPGFYVTLSSKITLHQTERIEFDQVKTDITNNYNKITGIFTVPKDGLYHFSLTMLSDGGNLHAEIMQNHQVIGLNHGNSLYDSGTINVVMSCKQGELVFVRHQAGRGAQKIHGYGYTAFSGFLIY
ncbi:uncharacterized protein PF3D7_1120000-like [Mytilus edulis]|uniref:uncharacterized protein PF3D7_1120000-like n=1 Tax=Mytilus edulis TaxID=6550 RepID=UPI0039EECFE4